MRRRGVERHVRRLQRRLGTYFPVLTGALSLLGIFVVAIVYYMEFEGWNFVDSFYMTVITMASVGFMEVNVLSPGGRLFTAAIILLGVGTFMFIAGALAQLIAEGTMQRMLWRRKVQRNIDKLKDHVIICGYGRIGSIVAQELTREGLPVVVIEKDPTAVQRLQEEGVLHLEGDATSDEMLMAAGLKRARTLIAALTQEAANVYVCLTGRQLSPKLMIVSRADSESHIHRLELAGADRVVLPHTIGGLRMAQTVIRPTVTSFIELAARGGLDLQMEELPVSENSELVGKNLIESRIRPRFNLIIVGIKKSSGDMIFNPAPQEVIEAGDTLLAIGAKDSLDKIEDIL